MPLIPEVRAGTFRTSEGFTGVRDGLDSTKPPYAWVIGDSLTNDLEELARNLGAAGFGVSTADPFVGSRRTIESHKESAMSGPLHFTYDDPATATDVTRSFPWAQSIVTVSIGYGPTAPGPAPTGAVVARFATHDHYRPLRKLLARLAERLQANRHRTGILVDDNRLVDRAAAARSGVGWIGRSTMVLAPGHGPWLLLGSVVTDARLEPTPSMRRSCGTCVACVPACPTGAITPDGLDARRCIATWLQSPGSLPRWVRPHIGRRIYGCDDCLTSCPPGFRALGTTVVELPFDELLSLDDSSLLERFSWWYVPRRDVRFIRRNLVVAAGNSREESAVPHLIEHLGHRSSLLRGHAAWALARSIGEDAIETLQTALDAETVREPIEEIEHALTMACAR